MRHDGQRLPCSDQSAGAVRLITCATHHHRQRALIAAYVRAAGRDAWLAPPDDPARRSGPWPSGRTWYLASRLLAAIEAVSPGNRVLQGAALAGLVGDQALPFLEYRETLNLPDPEDILKDPRSLVLPDRTDRAYAVCYSLVGAVLNNKTPERWQSAMIALGVACRKNADIPTAAARTLCDKRNRPEGADQVAGRVPAVLRADAGGEGHSARLISAEQAHRVDSRDGSARRGLLARARGRTSARVVSTRLLRAGALQPDSRQDRSNRQHGRRYALASLLQRRLARGAHASKRTPRC